MYFVSFFIRFITYKSSMTFHLNDHKKIDVIYIPVKSLFFCFISFVCDLFICKYFVSSFFQFIIYKFFYDISFKCFEQD